MNEVKMDNENQGIDLIEILKDLKCMSLQELAEKFLLLKEKLDTIKAMKRDLQDLFDHIRLHAIPEKMDADGINSIDFAGVGKIVLTGDMYTKIVDQDLAFEWLRENGHGEIIRETINHQTLKALVKDLLMTSAEQLPEGIFDIKPFTRASVRRIK